MTQHNLHKIWRHLFPKKCNFSNLNQTKIFILCITLFELNLMHRRDNSIRKIKDARAIAKSKQQSRSNTKQVIKIAERETYFKPSDFKYCPISLTIS